jgi:hypothetical protein
VKKIRKRLAPLELETTKHAVGGVAPVVLGESTFDDAALGTVWQSAGNLTRATLEP